MLYDTFCIAYAKPFLKLWKIFYYLEAANNVDYWTKEIWLGHTIQKRTENDAKLRDSQYHRQLETVIMRSKVQIATAKFMLHYWLVNYVSIELVKLRS